MIIYKKTYCRKNYVGCDCAVYDESKKSYKWKKGSFSDRILHRALFHEHNDNRLIIKTDGSFIQLDIDAKRIPIESKHEYVADMLSIARELTQCDPLIFLSKKSGGARPLIRFEDGSGWNRELTGELGKRIGKLLTHARRATKWHDIDEELACHPKGNSEARLPATGNDLVVVDSDLNELICDKRKMVDACCDLEPVNFKKLWDRIDALYRKTFAEKAKAEPVTEEQEVHWSVKKARKKAFFDSAARLFVDGLNPGDTEGFSTLIGRVIASCVQFNAGSLYTAMKQLTGAIDHLLTAQSKFNNRADIRETVERTLVKAIMFMTDPGFEPGAANTGVWKSFFAGSLHPDSLMAQLSIGGSGTFGRTFYDCISQQKHRDASKLEQLISKCKSEYRSMFKSFWHSINKFFLNDMRRRIVDVIHPLSHLNLESMVIHAVECRQTQLVSGRNESCGQVDTIESEFHCIE